MARTSSIHDHFIIWPSTVTLTFNLPEQMFQMALLAKLFWNPCINVGIIANLCDLLVWPWPSTYQKKVSNGTSPPQGQQLCHKILKSMHKCMSYGMDKSGHMFARTHIHCTKIVTAMSCFTARRPDNNTWRDPERSLVAYINQSPCTHKNKYIVRTCTQILTYMRKQVVMSNKIGRRRRYYALWYANSVDFNPFEFKRSRSVSDFCQRSFG